MTNINRRDFAKQVAGTAVAVALSGMAIAARPSTGITAADVERLHEQFADAPKHARWHSVALTEEQVATLKANGYRFTWTGEAPINRKELEGA